MSQLLKKMLESPIIIEPVTKSTKYFVNIATKTNTNIICHN